MNINEIKRVFYRRYDTSKSFLHYTFTGKLCCLLGHEEFINASFISCPLSMGIGMFARRQGANIINIQSAVSDRFFVYEKNMPTEMFGGNEKNTAALLRELSVYTEGAQILYKSDIPSFIPQKVEFNTVLTASLLKVAQLDFPPYERAYLAAMKEPIAPYLAQSYAKGGFVSLFDNYVPRPLPFSMPDLKIITVFTKERDISREDRVYSAMEKLCRKFGNRLTLSTLNLSHAYYAQQTIRDRRTVDYIHHLAGENSRLKAAARGLMSGKDDALIKAVNASQVSMERYWHQRPIHAYLCHTAQNTDGVRAARYCGDGVMIFADSVKTDYVTKMIEGDFEHNIGYKPVICVSDMI